VLVRALNFEPDTWHGAAPAPIPLMHHGYQGVHK